MILTLLALAAPLPDAASIRQTLHAVAHHQIHPIEERDYAPAASAEALRAARGPEGINWVYPWGVTLYGELVYAETTGDREAADFVLRHNQVAAREYVFLEGERKRLGAEALKGYRSRINGLMNLGSLDSCGAMGNELLEGMMAYPVRTTPEERVVADRVADWIVHRQDRLPDGTLWRSKSDGGAKEWKAGTIWMDDLYMAGPFLVRWSRFTHDPRYLHDAARQILNMARRLQDTDGVWFHAYFENEGKHSPFKWGRANGWGTVATVEVLSELPESDPLRAPLLAEMRRQFAGIRQLQAPSGLWHQLLDHPDLWEETSCSAMFSYAFARAANRGWVGPEYFAAARRAFAGLQTQVTPEGAVNGTCEGTNIGLTADYYANRRRPGDDLHGRGVVLLAGSELLKGRGL